MSRIFTTFMLFVLVSGAGIAQDVNFSQYEYVPQVLNPAAIATDDYMAVMIDYRAQKISSDVNFKSVSLFGKYPIINSNGDRKAAIGFGFLSDRSEGSADLKYYGLSSSLAYNFNFGNQWGLSAGAGAVYARKEFSLNSYTTGSQWVDNIGHVPDASSGETFQDLSTIYFSFNGGFQAYQADESGIVKHYLGVSLFHFNKPDESLLETSSEKAMRYSVQAGTRVFENEKYSIGPEVIYNQQAEHHQLGIGANFAYHLNDNNPYDPIKEGSVNLKVRNMVDQAVVLGIQLNQPDFSIGFSYDISLSSGAYNPAQSATEFAFAFKKRLTGKKKNRIKVVSDYSVKEIKQFYKKQTGEPEEEEEESGAEQKTDEEADEDGGVLQFELKREFNFGFNEAILDDNDKLYLDDLVSLMKLNPDIHLEVIGHADSIGTDRANKKISIQRAQAVEEYLINQGVSKKRVKAVGKGATEPLHPNDTEEHRAKNRRVEFAVYKK